MGINLNDYGYNSTENNVDMKYEKLPAGGYVCKIFDARLEPIEAKGMRLTCDVDIDEGEFKGYFSRRNGVRGWDFNAQFVRYVLRDEDKKITPTFKKFIKLLERENKNFHFDENDFEADQLRALKCGFLFGEKEYIDKLGFVRTSAKIVFPESIQRIREGKYKIPATQKLPPEKIVDSKEVEEILEGSTPVNPDDMPF